MSSHIGYGSFPTRVTTETTTVLEASGICVLDRILVNDPSGTTDLDLDIQDAAGNSLIQWLTMNLTAADAHRFGIACGPWGIRSDNGLQVVTLDNVGIDDLDLTFLHRKVAL